MNNTTTPGIGFYDALRTPDKRALKTIAGGRLKGMTDIKPQWRTQRMTEVFGLCGFGWRYDSPVFTYQQIGNEMNCICNTNLYVKVDGEWSAPIPGVGGSKVATMEKNGVYVSDEAEKMALTDALSVAMKTIGVAADVYIGYSDSKYIEPVKPQIRIKDKTYGIHDYDEVTEYIWQHINDVKELRALYGSQFQQLKDDNWTEIFKIRAEKLNEIGGTPSE